MQTAMTDVRTRRFTRCIAASKRVRWDIDGDVIRGRSFDPAHRFLPDGLSMVGEMDFLGADEKRYLSQIQGRTYANMFGLVERFINAKMLELSRDYWLGDQTALEALIRFSEEELKHQEMFRRIERKAAEVMPDGYEFAPDPDEVARAVLRSSTWAVLALTLHIELFTQVHYRESIAPNEELSPLFRDVFMFHWKEESQHALIDELEFVRHDATLGPEARDRAVDDFISLVAAVDGILQAQAVEDSRFFSETCGRRLEQRERKKLLIAVLAAYRWQYILSGARQPHFVKVLSGIVTADQGRRIQDALASLM